MKAPGSLEGLLISGGYSAFRVSLGPKGCWEHGSMEPFISFSRDSCLSREHPSRSVSRSVSRSGLLLPEGNGVRGWYQGQVVLQ